MSFQGYKQLPDRYLRGDPKSLPARSYIKGKLMMLYDVHTPKNETEPRVIAVLQVMPSIDNTVQSDYVTTLPDGKHKTTTITVRVELVSSDMPDPSGRNGSNKAMSEAHRQLKKLVLRTLQVAVGGGFYKGTTGNQEQSTRGPTIECAGNIMMRVAGGEAFTLALDRPSTSKLFVPEDRPWLSEPSPSPPRQAKSSTALPSIKTSKGIPPPQTLPSSRQSSSINEPGPAKKGLQPLSSHQKFGGIDPTMFEAKRKRRPSSADRNSDATQGKKQKPNDHGDGRISGDDMRRSDSSMSRASASSASIAMDMGDHEVRAGDGYTGGTGGIENEGRSEPPRSNRQPSERSTPSFNSGTAVGPLPESAPARPSPAELQRRAEAAGRRAAALKVNLTKQSARVDDYTHQELSDSQLAAVSLPSTSNSIRPPVQLQSEAKLYHPIQTRLTGGAGSSAIHFGAHPPTTSGYAPPPGSNNFIGASGGNETLGPLVFTPISGMLALSKGTSRCGNLVGIVETVGVLKSPNERSYDFSCTYLLTDPTVPTGGEDFVVTIFRKVQSEIPDLSPGMPIIFRNLNITFYQQKAKGQASSKVPLFWAALKNDKVVYGKDSDPRLSRSDEARLYSMRDWNQAKEGRSGPSVQIQAGKPFILLKDVRPTHFCKIAFLIVQTIDHREANKNYRDVTRPALELYVTDGTVYPGQLWNYHNVDAGLPPNTIFSVTIFTQPSDEEILRYFQAGTFISLPNVLPKLHNGALELGFRDERTAQQQDRGFSIKMPTVLDSRDEKVMQIKARIQAFQTRSQPGGQVPAPVYQQSAPHVEPPQDIARPAPRAQPAPPAPLRVTSPILPRVPSIPHSDAIGTKFEINPDLHPLTPMAEIINNQTVPNRYMVRARVARIYSVGKRAGSKAIKAASNGRQGSVEEEKVGPLVIQYCTKCCQRVGMDKNGVVRPYCEGCGDDTRANCELRYRFLVLLITAPGDKTGQGASATSESDGGTTLPVLISDDDAAELLPSLWTLGTSVREAHKEVEARQKRLESIKEQVVTLLMGKAEDGKRPKPIADWCIESYEAKSADGRGSEEGKPVLMYRMFGMKPLVQSSG